MGGFFHLSVLSTTAVLHLPYLPISRSRLLSIDPWVCSALLLRTIPSLPPFLPPSPRRLRPPPSPTIPYYLLRGADPCHGVRRHHYRLDPCGSHPSAAEVARDEQQSGALTRGGGFFSFASAMRQRTPDALRSRPSPPHRGPRFFVLQRCCRVPSAALAEPDATLGTRLNASRACGKSGYRRTSGLWMRDCT